jgi:hypothetical protein
LRKLSILGESVSMSDQLSPRKSIFAVLIEH